MTVPRSKYSYTKSTMARWVLLLVVMVVASMFSGCRRDEFLRLDGETVASMRNIMFDDSGGVAAGSSLTDVDTGRSLTHESWNQSSSLSSSSSSSSIIYSRVWTQMTFSAEFDQELIPHAVEHYKNVGLDPQYFLITLHHQLPNAPVLDKLTTWLRQEYGIPHVQTWHGNFTSQKNCDMRFKHRKAAKVKKCDWILKFDADELLRVPGGNMIRFLDFLGDQGFDSLSGNWIDRVADEGRLVDISAKPSIAEQFPLGCRFSALAGNATTRKLVAFRGYLKEKRAGHSLAKGLETCRYPAQLMIDHYKWSRPVYEKLRRRMEHYRNLEGVYWWKESEAFLNHIDENQGRVDVHREDFRCEDIRERMTMVHSYFPVEDGRAEADAEPCSRVRICPNKLR